MARIPFRRVARNGMRFRITLLLCACGGGGGSSPPAARPAPSPRSAAGSAISRVVSCRPSSPAASGANVPGTAVRQRRGRAVCRRQPGQCRQPDRRLAAGPVVERRRERRARGVLVRWRPHVGDLDGRVFALQRRQCRQRRRLRARLRPVGRDRPRRHRLSVVDRIFRRGEYARVGECHRRQPIARRRTQLERARSR